MTSDKPRDGTPTGWHPETELEHFMQCPVCRRFFDMRKLDQALEHWHDGPPDQFGNSTLRGK